jgi:hypothetical protein
MKYAVVIGPGANIYIPGFIKMCSGIQKLERGIPWKRNRLLHGRPLLVAEHRTSISVCPDKMFWIKLISRLGR